MITIMEMTFNSISDVPDFGSICLIDSKNGYKSYRLLDSDVNKLDLRTNAANGSCRTGSRAGQAYGDAV